MKYKQVVASYPQTIIRWSSLHSSICSNYILKAKQNNNDNNVHEEKRTKDTEGPTFFLNQLFLAVSRFWTSWCDIHEILIWKFLNVYYLNRIDLKLSEYTLFKSYYLLIPWFLFWFITGIRSHNSSQLNPFISSCCTKTRKAQTLSHW